MRVTLDGINCPVSAASLTEVKCTTDKRPGLPKTVTEIYIKGKGLVANQGNVFTYVNMWSDDTTWGGEFPPVEGESIYIPKGLNLFVDVKNSPRMNAILVEGELIFAPETDPTIVKTFDAHYIFLNGGKM